MSKCIGISEQLLSIHIQIIGRWGGGTRGSRKRSWEKTNKNNQYNKSHHVFMIYYENTKEKKDLIKNIFQWHQLISVAGFVIIFFIVLQLLIKPFFIISVCVCLCLYLCICVRETWQWAWSKWFIYWCEMVLKALQPSVTVRLSEHQLACQHGAQTPQTSPRWKGKYGASVVV